MYKIKSQAFTLTELLVTLFILIIIFTLSIRGYDSLVTPQLLRARTEHIYHFLRGAHTQAIKRNEKVYVYFCAQKRIGQWQMLMSSSAGCDCLTPTSCLLGERNVTLQISDGKRLFIREQDITFVGKKISYMPMRFRVNAGSIIISDGFSRRLKIIQSIQRLKICALGKDLWNYKKC